MKRKISLSKKLSIKRTVLATLSMDQRLLAAGGAVGRRSVNVPCATYDPSPNCATHPLPGHICV
ncbi:MAG TPA: class I lanthipeptide [Chitinophaga sp.]|uniref:class I lanthipeptide n=1 Tax=Chitinophaga sp. TaxID=1869181 RepID=UPI002BF3EAA3|nr:class I lanthipeptide [Chitinophaga sp.]HVI47252.1 class I lanthipeptide [Chitinophaga sp.]